MKTNFFYQKIIRTVAQPPAERRPSLVRFHTDVATPYLDSIRRLTTEDAVRIGSDGRTIGQVIGHIAEWERYAILAAGEILSGIDRPQIMRLSGFLEQDGRSVEFTGVDGFNGYQAARHAAWSWKQIQNLALETAANLQLLFSTPALLPWERLEKTDPYEWHLPNGRTLTIPCGWYIWMAVLEHEAVEHAADLGLTDRD